MTETRRTARLEAARRAARAAEEVIRRSYRGELAVEIKPDDTPVTAADRESERVIRGVLAESFPDDGIYGEELGRDEGADKNHLWLIDPIDGTKSFIRRQPFFSTQIAHMERERLVLGVSNAPEFGELASAERGGGAFLNDEPIRVSDVDRLRDAMISFGNITTLAGGSGWDGLSRLVRTVNRTRGYGDFYHYHLLAAGKIDVVLESDVNILDIAALSVIVEEAGGRVTELDGSPLTLETTTILATNGPLHDEVRKLLEGG